MAVEIVQTCSENRSLQALLECSTIDISPCVLIRQRDDICQKVRKSLPPNKTNSVLARATV